MRIFLAFFSICVYLGAVNITETNIYERNNRIDIMLSFDAPYEGIISQKKEDSYLAIELKNMGLKQDITKETNTLGISKIRIFKDGENSFVLLQKKGEIAITASKSAAGYGLRLRVTKIQSNTKDEKPQSTQQTTQTAPKKTEDEPKEENELQLLLKNNNIDLRSYLAVLAVLAALVIVLLIVKKRVGKNVPQVKKSGSWLFPKEGAEMEGIKVISQKQIDVKNRIVIFEADGVRYVVIIGSNGTVILDKKHKDYRGASGNRFDAFLNENRERLENYINETNRLENYKQRASGDF